MSILVGLAMLWAFGRFSNQSAIRETKRRIAARLYEFRLFVDEPKLIWQAQTGLLRDNLRYLGLMLVPAAVLALPMLVLFAYATALAQHTGGAVVTGDPDFKRLEDVVAVEWLTA